MRYRRKWEIEGKLKSYQLNGVVLKKQNKIFLHNNSDDRIVHNFRSALFRMGINNHLMANLIIINYDKKDMDKKRWQREKNRVDTFTMNQRIDAFIKRYVEGTTDFLI